MKNRKEYMDKIKGCMYGSAVGDALGYPVEFKDVSDIRRHYKSGRIEKYDISFEEGMALISDDTQMSLFTANGLLVQETLNCLRGTYAYPRVYVQNSYLDWYKTQIEDYAGFFERHTDHSVSWLLEVPDIWSRRCPGRTCMSALKYRYNFFTATTDFIKEPINDSKGCGGIMRIAPIALWYSGEDMSLMDREAAQIAAITHGHPLGYLPAAALAHILHLLIYEKTRFSLVDAIKDAEAGLEAAFSGDVERKWIETLIGIMEDSIERAQNGLRDIENIRALGQGWVAEETLGIALYCALRHSDDFSEGVISAVNHSGDSDSTGAVAGNILGAICGYDSIENKWKNNLDLSRVILEMAEDIGSGYPVGENDKARKENWVRKYVHSHWKL